MRPDEYVEHDATTLAGIRPIGAKTASNAKRLGRGQGARKRASQ